MSKAITINSWERCETCQKYKRIEVEIKPGDSVSFPVEKQLKRSTRITMKEGKLDYIKGEYAHITCRKQSYISHVCNLAPVHGPGALSVALIGQCTCQE